MDSTVVSTVVVSNVTACFICAVIFIMARVRWSMNASLMTAFLPQQLRALLVEHDLEGVEDLDAGVGPEG
jgi:hypothetical protein